MNTVIHDLTILYMNNSMNLSDIKDPSEYAQIYDETYSKIKLELKELAPKKQSSNSRPNGHRRTISPGI